MPNHLERQPHFGAIAARQLANAAKATPQVKKITSLADPLGTVGSIRLRASMPHAANSTPALVLRIPP